MEKISHGIEYQRGCDKDKSPDSGQCHFRESSSKSVEPHSSKKSKIDAQTASAYGKRVPEQEKGSSRYLMADGCKY